MTAPNFTTAAQEAQARMDTMLREHAISGTPLPDLVAEDAMPPLGLAALQLPTLAQTQTGYYTGFFEILGELLRENSGTVPSPYDHRPESRFENWQQAMRYYGENRTS